MFRKKQIVSPPPDQQDRVESAEQAARAESKTGLRVVYLYPAAIKAIGGDTWGYINAKGKWIIHPIYEHAGDFQENELAIISYMGLAGVIDLNGYLIVKPMYDTINPFSEGRATVIDRQGFKVIDESGKVLTAKGYSFIGNYKEGRAVVADTIDNGKYAYGYLNKWGKEVIPLSFETASDFESGKAVAKLKENVYALIGPTGKIIHQYSYPFVGEYGEGLLVFKNKDDKYGYMIENGTVVLKPQFTGAQAFSGGRAVVNLANDTKNLYGLINKNGRYIFKPNYSDLLDLGEGRVALGRAIDTEKPYIGSVYALGDDDGHILTGFIYNRITKFANGLASASDDKYTFIIDPSGKRVESLPIVDGSGELRFEKSVIKGEIDFRLVYFNKKGERIWEQNRIIELRNGMRVHEEKYTPNKDFLVYYPRLSGLGVKDRTVNQTLKDLAGIKETPAHLQLESNYMGDFEIPFYQGDLLEIEITGYDYPFGAAHGMPVKKYAHLDLHSGAFYQLKDLFKPGSRYVKVISAIIGKQIIDDPTYSYIFPGSYKGIQADQPFFVKSNALSIFFVPYEIAPYAAGFPTFTIPFDDIEDIIDQAGAFWKSFH